MNRALVEHFLGGAVFPSTRDELVEWARRHGDSGDVVSALSRLGDREYRSANDVGEELRPVEPERRREPVAAPRPRSGDPPGGDAYVAS